MLSWGACLVMTFIGAFLIGRMWERAKRERPYCREESCRRRVDIAGARCQPCLEGIARKYEMLTAVAKAQGTNGKKVHGS